MRIDEVDCFTNRSWASSQSVRASLWQQYSYVAYSRQDGHIIESLPVSANFPMSFNITGLFQIYNAFYGLANLSDSSHRTDNITATIRYHTVEQTTAWLQGNVGIDGLGGDVDHYWSSLAVRSLLAMPLMDFVTPKTAEYLTTGSSAKQFYRLLIPRYSAYSFFGMVLFIVIWSAYCLLFVCPSVVAPNNSLFPEIDFGSKCVPLESGRHNNGDTVVSSVGYMLYPLSNATSKEVSKELTGTRVYAGSTGVGGPFIPRVMLGTRRGELQSLVKNLRYL